MQLITYPNPILGKRCEEVSNNISDKQKRDRKALADEMFRIMTENGGVGLAAPQVGLNERMFAWNQHGHNMAIWNPKLSWLSGEIDSIEGCLSFPGIQVGIKRATKCTLSGTHIEGLLSQKDKPTYHPGVGEEYILFGDSITTPIWQHEIDRLDGKLIIDNLRLEDRIDIIIKLLLFRQ